MIDTMSKLSSHATAYYWFYFIRPQAAGYGRVRAK